MRLLKHNPKTVALIGMGPSITSFMQATLTQEYQPDWADEIWAINMASNCIQHDVVFWMDDLDDQEKFKPGLFSCLRRRGKPVITTKVNKEILPKSYDYPIDDIAQMSLHVFGKVYLNNGVAQAVAYAMWKKVKTLKLFGCDFTYPDRNYAESGRACTEAWLTLASAGGMELVLPDKTSLFDCVEPQKGVYGYKDQPQIILPGGLIHQPGGELASGTYIAEDSSGQGKKVDELRASISGDGGKPSATPRKTKVRQNGSRPTP